MANGDQSQTKVNAFGDEKPEVDKSPTGFGSVELVSTVQALMPEYDGINPYNLKKRLINDQSLFDEFSEKYFYSGLSDEQLKAYQEEDPEKLQQDLSRFKNNFQTRLSESSFSGEPYKDTLISRSRQLSSNVNEVPVEEYKEVIRNNKKKYQKKGLVNGAGEFTMKNDLALSQKLIEDNELHQTVLEDRYSQFQDELGQAHNAANVVKGDPTELTRAWVMYDKFGSEGLTQYINQLQFGQGEQENLGESFQQVEDAKQFFQQASVNGKTPQDYMKEFVMGKVEADFNIPEDTLAYRNNNPANLKFARQKGAKKGEGGFAKFDSMEEGYQALIRQINLDKNRGDTLKSFIYEYAPPSENNTKVYLDHLVSETGQTPDTKLSEIPDDDLAKAIIQQETGGSVNLKSRADKLTFRPPQPNDELTKEVPPDSNAYSNMFYKANEDGTVDTQDPQDISRKFLKKHLPEKYERIQDYGELRKGGAFSDEYKNLTYSIYEQAIDGNQYDISDLINTVKANGEGRLDDAERPVYRIDLQQLPFHARASVDALRNDPEFDYLFDKVSDGVYDFKPKQREENLSFFQDIKNFVFDTTYKTKETEDGFEVEEVAEKGLVAQTWNTVATAGLAATDALVRYFYEPSVRITNNLGEYLGFDVSASRQFEEDLQKQLNVDLAQGLTQETDGFFPNALGEVAPFVEYMGAMYAGGRGILSGTTKALQSITGVKKATDLLRLGSKMKGSSRLGAQGLKLSNALKNKSPWATGVGVFYTGGVGIETTQPAKVSFYETVPQFLGYEPTNDVTELYRRSSGATKVALDAAGSLAMDFMFDTAIAGARFGGEKLMQKLGKQEFKSIRFDQTKGHYVKTDSPEFHHDFRRFWSNFTNDLADLPMGELGQSMAKEMAGNAKNAETLHDFTKIFTDESGKVMDGIKTDIRENLEYLNRTLGDGVELDDIRKTNLVEQQYGQFLDNLSDQMYGFLRTSDDVDLPLRFAQTLDEQVPTIREFKVGGERINPYDAATYRQQGYNLTVKDGRVYQVADRQWTSELANRIRQRALEFNKDRVVQRKLEENNFFKGADNQEQQVNRLNERADAILGTPVKVKGKTGYVTDWGDEGFTVKTAEGDVETGVVFDNLDINQIINRKQVVQRMQAEKQGAFVNDFMENLNEQGVRGLLPSAEPQTRETDLLREIDEVEQSLNRVNRTREGIERVQESNETRGNQLRALRRQEKQLRQRKESLQRDLTEFYMDNPQVQNARRVNPEIVRSTQPENITENQARIFREVQDEMPKKDVMTKGERQALSELRQRQSGQVIDADQSLVRQTVDEQSNRSFRLEDSRRQVEKLKETARMFKKFNNQNTKLPFC